jgi:hypothetical protein
MYLANILKPVKRHSCSLRPTATKMWSSYFKRQELNNSLIWLG